MKEKSKYRKKLSLKVSIGLLVLGVFVITSSCIVGYLRYTDVIEKMYNDKAYHIAETVIEYIDGDLIESYYDRLYASDEETLSQVSQQIQDEAEYKELHSIMEVLRENLAANYIYIADQRDKEGNVTSTLTYLLDVDNLKDDYSPFIPGDKGEMNEEFLSDSKYIYETGNRSDNYFYSHSEFGFNTSAIEPIKNKDGKVVAFVGVELAMETLQTARTKYIVYVVALGILLTTFIIIVFMMYLKRQVIDPVRIITQEADEFVNNEAEISTRLSEISTGDEIQQLANSILQMEVDIRRYIDNITQATAERERIGAELNIATKIQEAVLPNSFPAFPERNEFDLYASMCPAKEVGGDFYDFFMVDDDHLVLIMADVSGKGIPGALFMMVSKMLLNNYAQSGLSAKEILEIVNNKLCENNQAEMFVTVWMGILEISTGKLDCANAGHEYPVIYRNGGTYQEFKDKHGFVLGGMEDMPQHAYELQLMPGDKLFVYTDGVAEATDSSDTLYGTERMLKALNAATDANPEKTLKAVGQDVDTFVGEAPQFDDLTMLCLHYMGTDTMKEDETTAAIAVDATLENLPQVTAFVEEQMEKLEVPMKAQMQINIAVDEILSNIAHYAYGETVGEVIVKVEGAEGNNGIALTFVDHGVPYDPLEKEDPDTSLSVEEREIGGLGIFMVKKTMDEMAYQRKEGQNILKIRKNY